MRKSKKRLYQARLKLAAVVNILEVAAIVSPLADFNSMSRMKAAKQIPLRSLIFALAARCSRLIDEVCYNLEFSGMQGGRKGFDPALACAALGRKKREIARAQELLAERDMASALAILAKAREGMEALAEEMDGVLEKNLE